MCIFPLANEKANGEDVSMAKKTFDVSHNGKLLRWACFVFSAFFAVGASYADNIDNQDYVLSGAMDFIAEAGVTDDYTEL